MVRNRQHQADFVGTCIDFHIFCDTDEPCVVVLVVLDVVFHDLQAIEFCTFRRGNGCNIIPITFCHIFCRCSCIFKYSHFHMRQGFQKFTALAQSLFVGNDFFDVGEICAVFSQQRMIDVEFQTSDDMEFMTHHQVINFCHRACGTVFDRQHPITAQTAFHRIENMFKAFEEHGIGHGEQSAAGTSCIGSFCTLTRHHCFFGEFHEGCFDTCHDFF